jgi:hypothetical protein
MVRDLITAFRAKTFFSTLKKRQSLCKKEFAGDPLIHIHTRKDKYMLNWTKSCNTSYLSRKICSMYYLKQKPPMNHVQFLHLMIEFLRIEKEKQICTRGPPRTGAFL